MPTRNEPVQGPGHAARGVGAWLRNEDRSPVPRAGSRHSVAVGHPETDHRIEDLARQLHFEALSSEGSTSHTSTDDRLVSVDGVLHQAARAVA